MHRSNLGHLQVSCCLPYAHPKRHVYMLVVVWFTATKNNRCPSTKVIRSTTGMMHVKKMPLACRNTMGMKAVSRLQLAG